jgi:hypothetical protein
VTLSSAISGLVKLSTCPNLFTRLACDWTDIVQVALPNPFDGLGLLTRLDCLYLILEAGLLTSFRP